jgi:rhodanese-related sulfurtransferase
MGLPNILRALAHLLAGNPERKTMTLKNLEPAEVADLLNKNEIVLIDVREAPEYAAAHIKGAELVPLSRFDPHTLPGDGHKRIVLHCGVGGRSARAVAACQAAGIAVDSHMKGGIQAWMAAGLPVER